MPASTCVDRHTSKNPNSIIFLGQSLFEVVIAVGLSAIILSGVVKLASTSVRNSSFTRNNALATKYVQEELEWLRGERDAGWDSFVGCSGSPCVPSKIAKGGCDTTDNSLSWGGTCTIDPTFSRIASFSCFYLDLLNPTPPPVSKICSTDDSSEINIVEIEVTVSWTDAQGTHNVTSQTRFTDWK